MAIPYDLEYKKPATLQECLELLSEYKEKSRILAGGTDLANEMKMGFRVPEILIDVKGISELKKIELKDNKLFIGSGVTFSEIIKSKVIKDNAFVMWEAAHLVASNGVRNRATMVGNICSAVPCMDSAGPLLVHEAVIHAQSKSGTRDINTTQWFVDSRKTSIQPDELVTGVTLTIPKIKTGGSYNKQMRYSGEDLSQSNVTILALEDKTYRVAFGSVAPTPKRSLKIEDMLKGKEIDDKLISEIQSAIEQVIAPITDVRATKEYRMHIVKIMFERGLKTAITRLKQPKLIN
jgi:carbon-monoxide dehydrogenase medium subunit